MFFILQLKLFSFPICPSEDLFPLDFLNERIASANNINLPNK